MEEKKFYWLKLKRDFFKRHDIRIIEGMPDGRMISLFYIKLMLESVDHDGELRFSETIPYTPEMLSMITFTDLDTVRRGLEVLESFGLVIQTEDGTLKLPKVTNMIDSASDTDAARRMRRLREQNVRTSEQNVRINEQNVTDERTKRYEIKSKSKRQSKSKSKENIKRNLSSFVPPTVEEVRTYCEERGNFIDPEAFVAFYDSKGWKVGSSPMKNWKSAVITWEKRNKPVKKEESFADLLERWEGEDG